MGTRKKANRERPAHSGDGHGADARSNSAHGAGARSRYLYGWSVQVKAVPEGEELIVTGKGVAEEQKIRSLGSMGIMVQGAHQMHHLAIAKGEMMHVQ